MELKSLKEQIEKKRRELDLIMKRDCQQEALELSRELDRLIFKYMSQKNGDALLMS
ncbi:aspartyl-phosphate phosphatase Spo0E family protein [Natroniella acetigena]|uniref:aspartyl-phosphate phosphatase Spo0E family protein n=1 Tax=Natroniella acetigena TaxID=52004 RepID=UPI00200B2203|nr:aspartyl-phosphate phosphatase Spo0E family protein [Natroniella acetigena]MCK8826771.1 aspartyl-phosphate phosphatase Spo0E family protein [Natroniella acetigena]